MLAEKADFLENRFIPLLISVPPSTPPVWGKMNFQQMVEHYADAVKIASGRTTAEKLVTPPERLPGMREFMMSEKPFSENTRNPLLSDTPPPVKYANLAQAINELKTELEYFFHIFRSHALSHTLNPFFGNLDFEENIQLLHKHALHHLKQFGVTAAYIPAI